MRGFQKQTKITLFALSSLLILNAGLLARDKTDVVLMKNGDSITGEIKKLEKGRLKLSTDYMSSVYIEWKDIRKLTSQYLFEVEVQSGQKYFGAMRPPSGNEDQIEILGVGGPAALDHLDIVEITPLEDNFWDKLDGYVDVGLTFNRANRVKEFSLGTEIRQRTRKRELLVDYSSRFSGQQDVESKERNVLGVSFKKFLSNRWFAVGLTQFTQNTELDLDLRTVLGGGFGRTLIQTNNTLLSLAGAGVYSREKFSRESCTAAVSQSSADDCPDGDVLKVEEIGNNIEAMIGLNWETFRFDTPKLDIRTTLEVLPNMTDFGRIRVDLNSRIQYEIFKDFFFAVTLFDQYDSRPPSSVEKNDFGITTSIGWSF